MTTAADNWFRCPVATADGSVDIYLDQEGRWFMESDLGPDRQDWETALLMIPVASRELPKQVAEEHFAELLREVVTELDSDDGVVSGEGLAALGRLDDVLPQVRDWLVAVDRLPMLVVPPPEKLADFDSLIFNFEDGRFIFALRAQDGWREMKPDPAVPGTEFQQIPCSLSDVVDFTDGTNATMAPILEAHDQLVGLLLSGVSSSLHRIRAGVDIEPVEFAHLVAAVDLAGELAKERSAI